MDLRKQKELAAEVAKVGVYKIVLDPARYEDLKEAITKADIRALIKDGAITIKQKWMRKIRILRTTLRTYRDENKFDMKTFVDLKQKVKGGFFRDNNHLMFYVKSNKLLKEDTQ